jgi:UDP-N-acetylmuramoyl-L-alanyl-D-glutamate--2,6-diaminopimelate ligase
MLSFVRTVGVTGTNGKTTTTTWIAAALATIARPVARITTVGFFLDDQEIDVPKTHHGSLELVRRAEALGGRFCAIEYTSESLARGYAQLWPAEVAAFTNLTHDHLDAHREVEHYLASKAQLFMQLPSGGTAVLNGCDPSSALIEEVLPAGVRVIRYGVPSRGESRSPLDLVATNVALSWSGTEITLNEASFTVRAIGEIFAENALAALGAAIAMGADRTAAMEALSRAPAPPGRFEVIGRGVVIDYAHTPDALARTLRSARALCTGRVTVVFGAGGNRDVGKRPGMGAAASIADRIFLTTDNPRDEDPHAIAAGVRAGIASGEVIEEPDREAAINRAIAEASEDDVVVIAGKGHERTQTIAGVIRPFDDAAIARAQLGSSRSSRLPTMSTK